MRIKDVQVLPLMAKLKHPFGYAQGWYDKREALLVKITTDSGLVGYGECFGPIAATREHIVERLAPQLIGRDPLQHEVIWSELFASERAAYKTYIPLAAISGIDIALWDIKGKYFEVPIGYLLGRTRSSIQIYATGHYFVRTESFAKLTNKIVEEAIGYVEDGFKFLKIKTGLKVLGMGVEHDLELVRQVREALPDSVGLMVDANYAYNLCEAKWLGKRLSELGIVFFEEPVSPDHVAGYQEVRVYCQLPIAGGECLSTCKQFHPFFNVRALDIAQPDLCMAGGITETWKIAQLASLYGIKVYPHIWGTGVALAAALQFCAALPEAPLVEFDRSENPLRDATTEWLEWSRTGVVTVPKGPGLGVEVDERTLRRFLVR